MSIIDKAIKKEKDNKKSEFIEEKVKLLRIDASMTGIFLDATKSKMSVKTVSGETYTVKPENESFVWFRKNNIFGKDAIKCYVAFKGISVLASWTDIFKKENYNPSKISAEETTQLIEMTILKDVLNVQTTASKKDMIVYIIIGAILGWVLKDMLIGSGMGLI